MSLLKPNHDAKPAVVIEPSDELAQLYTLSTAPKHEANPFLDGLIINTRHQSLTVARGTQLQTADGGHEAMTTIAQVKLVDESQFVKLYTSQLGLFFDLSHTAFRMLSVVLYAVQHQAIGTDRFYLDFHDVPAIVKAIGLKSFSRKTYERGLGEMLSKGFLARSAKPNLYFFNPALFFNGDRARFVTEYRRSRASDAQLPLL